MRIGFLVLYLTYCLGVSKYRQCVFEVIYAPPSRSLLYSQIIQNTYDGSDSEIHRDWEGSFPNNLFVSRDTLIKGKGLDMKIQVTPLDSSNYRKITFESYKFTSPVVGEWRGESELSGTKNVKTIHITDPKMPQNRIYLAFN
ncbi:hypothetical protein [Mycoplasma ovis]|nr:hypothetical protein [Mycoplasma ovis]